MKILHCPSWVGRNGWTLSRAERKIGLNSDVMVNTDHWSGVPADIKFDWRTKPSIRREIERWNFVRQVIKDYDVLHFNFGQSLISYNMFGLYHVDLPFLKKRNKVLIVTYQGSDARQVKYCVTNHKITPYNEDDINRKKDKIKRKQINKFDRYADKIFAITPDLLDFLPLRSEYRPHSKVDIEEWKPVIKNNFYKQTLKIVHAPTSRKLKGTDIIINIVNDLITAGYPLELELIENISNDKAKSKYQQADLLIDQLLIGWYGGVSVELMALKKPVFAYINEDYLNRIPQEMKKDLPIINSTPETLYEQLKYYMDNRDLFENISKKSRLYVEKWHDPVKIALRMKELYSTLYNEKYSEVSFDRV